MVRSVTRAWGLGCGGWKLISSLFRALAMALCEWKVLLLENEIEWLCTGGLPLLSDFIVRQRSLLFVLWENVARWVIHFCFLWVLMSWFIWEFRGRMLG